MLAAAVMRHGLVGERTESAWSASSHRTSEPQSRADRRTPQPQSQTVAIAIQARCSHLARGRVRAPID
jgi:hypothetical protein